LYEVPDRVRHSEFLRRSPSDFDGGVHQSSDMRNDLVGDAAGVAAYPGRIERDAAMEALRLRRLRTQGRLFCHSSAELVALAPDVILAHGAGPWNVAKLFLQPKITTLIQR